MGRLIDEDDVLKVLCHELCHPGAICPDGYCEEIREKLKDVPTAHPEPPKIGKWENRNLRDTELGMATYTDDCSVCKLPAIRLIKGDGWEWEFYYHYCPNCGTPMQAEE